MPMDRLIELLPQLWDATLETLFVATARSEEHTSELQSQSNLVCRLLLEKKNHQRHARAHAFAVGVSDLQAQGNPVGSSDRFRLRCRDDDGHLSSCRTEHAAQRWPRRRG